MGPFDGLHSLPLTPALSLGEREKGPPSLCHTRDGDCQASERKTRVWRLLFPPPEGEGQGEGKRRFDSYCVSHIQGTVSPGLAGCRGRSAAEFVGRFLRHPKF